MAEPGKGTAHLRSSTLIQRKGGYAGSVSRKEREGRKGRMRNWMVGKLPPLTILGGDESLATIVSLCVIGARCVSHRSAQLNHSGLARLEKNVRKVPVRPVGAASEGRRRRRRRVAA